MNLTTEGFYYFTVFASCFLSVYFSLYLQWEVIPSLILCGITGVFLYLTSIKFSKDNLWKKKAICQYIIFFLTCFHLPVLYFGISHINYKRNAKDEYIIKIDEFVLGWAFPKGQLSLFLDTSDILGPHVPIGFVIHNILQLFYLTFFTLPYISIYFKPLYLCVKENIFRSKNNGLKKETYYNNWKNIYYLAGNYNMTYVQVLFFNSLIPAVSPRFYFKSQYKHEIVLWSFINMLHKVTSGHTSANSFPSGHIAQSFCFVYPLYRLGYKCLSISILVISINITLATLFLRKHYLGDFIASLLIAVVSNVVSLYVVKRDKLQLYKNLNEMSKELEKITEF